MKRYIAYLRLHSFFSMVLLPMAVVATYLCLVATPGYDSKAMMTIQSSNAGQGANGGAMLMGPAAEAITNGYLMRDIVSSPDMFHYINATFPIQAHYGHGDIISRFGGLMSFFQHDEGAAYTYYTRHVFVKVDTDSGVTTLHVRAYNGADAQAINQAVLRQATHILNHKGLSIGEDARNGATHLIAMAEDTIRKDQARLDEARTRSGTFDADAYYKAQLEATGNAAGKKLDADAQYRAIARVTPNNPMAGSYRAEAEVYAKYVKDAAATSTTTGTTSTSHTSMGEVAMLKAMVEMDIKVLQAIRIDAASHSLQTNAYYVEMESAPERPGYAAYPRILLDLLYAFVVLIIIRFFVGPALKS